MNPQRWNGYGRKGTTRSEQSQLNCQNSMLTIALASKIQNDRRQNLEAQLDQRGIQYAPSVIHHYLLKCRRRVEERFLRARDLQV